MSIEPSGPCARCGYKGACWLFFLYLFVINTIFAIVLGNKPNLKHAYGIILIVFASIVAALFAWGLVNNCVNIDVYRKWPFSYFWLRWTIQFKRFGWKACNETPKFSDSCMTSKLCDRCSQIVCSSGLIVGSKYLITRREEWHDFQDSLNDLENSSQEFCHMCTTLWCSIPDERKGEITEADNNLRGDIHQIKAPGSGPNNLNVPYTEEVIQKSMQLRIKIAEDPTGRWYDDHKRYMQLFRGKVAISKEICINQESWKRPVELGTSTGSAVSISLVKEWLYKCESNHKHCKPEGDVAFLPTRLIFVGIGVDSDELRLHLTTTEDTHIKYLALSHCWGGSIPFVLNETNYEEMLSRIDITKLALNFQDAIALTRKLGFGYLWIDSLCIVQGSQTDWQKEAQKMSSVYAQAYCTISSCGSPSSDGGCFHQRNPLPYFSCKLWSSDHESLTIAPEPEFYRRNTFFSEVNDSPLSKRSWAFQERLLSRCIIHFGATLLFFECNTLYASERARQGIPYKVLRSLNRDGIEYGHAEEMRRENMRMQYLPNPEPMTNSVGKYARMERKRRMRERKRNPNYRPANEIAELFQDAIFGYRGAFDTLRQNKAEELTLRQQLRLHQRWLELVTMYTSGKLTHGTDRLMGISGIANTIQGQKTGSQYLSGIWKHHLHFDLLWSLAEAPRARPIYRAPSWSWISIDGKVHQQLLSFKEENDDKSCEIKLIAEVRDVVVTEADQSTSRATALIDGGYMDLHCQMHSLGMTTLGERTTGQLTLKSGDAEHPTTPSVTLNFALDIILPNSDNIELICVEILRMSFPNRWLGREAAFRPSSHGILLQRVKNRDIKDGSPVQYQRVGRFWVKPFDNKTNFSSESWETIRII